MIKVYSTVFFSTICLFLFLKVNFSEKSETKALSRSKRYLVFPEGSSFQLEDKVSRLGLLLNTLLSMKTGTNETMCSSIRMFYNLNIPSIYNTPNGVESGCKWRAKVFCVQTSALIPIGDIFLYGNTAALAWSLPTDPKHLLMLNNKNDEKEEQDEEKTEKTSKRSSTASLTLAKRSVNENMTFKEKLKIKIDRTKMHNEKTKRDFLEKQHLDRESLEFHRVSRVGLYEKLEPLITSLGGDGRQCVLYKLCESAKSSEQGTFLQEFLRVIFTFPKGRQINEEHKVYDEAHTPGNDCAALYPDCDFHLPIQTNK